jgi:leucyl-tRNA synthetase
MDYNFPEIEKKWQQKWRESATYRVTEKKDIPKYYVLDMFPYPSGAGLHVGHPLGYIASDIIARYKRHQGFNVLHPMGYDSFGLPAEQYAIQTGQHPEITTKTNIARYREQLDKIGFAYDWDREVQTSDPNYYHWTQWIFSLIYNSWFNLDTNKAEHISVLVEKFNQNGSYNVNAAIDADWYKNLPADRFPLFGKNFVGEFTATDWKSMNEEQHQLLLMHFRMAYLADSWVNWCPALGTVLANDEVKDGKSERGGHPVEQKLMKQWSMRITAYAQRLLDGLDSIDWPENIKEVQRNWIGRSDGASVSFQLENHAAAIEVFTTRPDTIFGVSFMTLAPEHELVLQITTDEYRADVESYIAQAKLKTERDRQSDVKNVTGQFTGAHVLHPFTGEKIPVWIGEYVLVGYGTGAVMAVPAGDQRDWDFAKKFNLSIPSIFAGVDISEKAEASKEAILCNSQMLDGLSFKEATKKIISEIESRGIGQGKINYRMRDAVFSRQRYWGEPFPVYYKNDIPYLCADSDLPIELPEVDKYLPTDTGEPPLARAANWFYPTGHTDAHEDSTLEETTSSEQSNSNADAVKKWHDWQLANKDIWKELKDQGKEQRKHHTDVGQKMWQHLRDKKQGVTFKKQHAFGRFIVDYVCFEKKLVLQIDGEFHAHEKQKLRDDVCATYLGIFGYTILRIHHDEIREDVKGVLKKIHAALKKPSTSIAKAATAQHQEKQRMEYNTMPGWAGSSWYFLRYMDPKNKKAFASREKVDYWNQVDLYMGGAEHATGHLLYSRFWTKILFDHGYIGFDEPFKKMINQGMILGRSNHVYRIQNSNTFVTSEKKEEYETQQLYVDINIVDNDILDTSAFMKWLPEYSNAEFILNDKGQYTCTFAIDKMSKRWYNVANPDDLCEKFGADTLRMYEMFLGPVEQSKPWDTKGINGVHNFLRKFWRLAHDSNNTFSVTDAEPTKAELKTLHTAIKKVTEDLNRYSWNTVVSTLMICVNELTEQKSNNRKVIETLSILISPYAPHFAEEMWEELGHTASITTSTWPVFNEAYLTESEFDYPVSFNGKTRFNILLGVELSQDEVTKAVLAHEQTAKYLEGKEPKKIIVVPKRIVNVVV